MKEKNPAKLPLACYSYLGCIGTRMRLLGRGLWKLIWQPLPDLCSAIPPWKAACLRHSFQEGRVQYPPIKEHYLLFKLQDIGFTETTFFVRSSCKGPPLPRILGLQNPSRLRTEKFPIIFVIIFHRRVQHFWEAWCDKSRHQENV